MLKRLLDEKTLIGIPMIEIKCEWLDWWAYSLFQMMQSLQWLTTEPNEEFKSINTRRRRVICIIIVIWDKHLRCGINHNFFFLILN